MTCGADGEPPSRSQELEFRRCVWVAHSPSQVWFKGAFCEQVAVIHGSLRGRLRRALQFEAGVAVLETGFAEIFQPRTAAIAPFALSSPKGDRSRVVSTRTSQPGPRRLPVNPRSPAPRVGCERLHGPGAGGAREGRSPVLREDRGLPVASPEPPAREPRASHVGAHVRERELLRNAARPPSQLPLFPLPLSSGLR